MYRLLVIDDDAAIAKSVAAVATGCGFEVEITTEASEFFDRLESWQPTHIVLDLNMPDVDGIEVLRHLGNAKSTAKIVVASGVDGRIVESVRHLGREHGLNVIGTLLKPFRAAELRKLLA
jgi:CheY-like chemotaxis protein